MRPLRLLLAVLSITISLMMVACGGDSSGGDSWCPGVVCTNCAGDCDAVELNCAEGQTVACVGGAFFDADENLRCQFCSD